MITQDRIPLIFGKFTRTLQKEFFKWITTTIVAKATVVTTSKETIKIKKEKDWAIN
jgi:hypothetical protein